MPKISDRPLVRVHIRLWRDDYEALQQSFGRTEFGPTTAIRNIVHQYVQQAREQAQSAIDDIDLSEIDFDKIRKEIEAEAEAEVGAGVTAPESEE